MIKKNFLKYLKKFKPDGIINLAAESHVDRSIDNPAPFLKTNIFGTYSLLQATSSYWKSLKKNQKKFLNLFTYLQMKFMVIYPKVRSQQMNITLFPQVRLMQQARQVQII